MDGNLNPIIPEKIRIVQIAITRSNVDCDLESLKDKDVHGFEMKVGHNIAYNFDDKMCRVRLRLEFIGVSEDHEHLELNGNFTFEYHFLVENMEDLIKRIKNGIQLDRLLPATLLGMSYSTARGVILERTSNTPFSGIILPAVDPNLILNEQDFVIEKVNS